MRKQTPQWQYLLSLPPRMAQQFARLENKSDSVWFTAAPGAELGTGAAIASICQAAWQARGKQASFSQWLGEGQKVIILGDNGRLLPAYSAVGNACLPLPALRWSRGQRLKQSLLDLQLPVYQRLFRHAGPGYAALITRGDVLPRLPAKLPPFAQADVLGLGLWETPEKAKNFGVFFCPRACPEELAFYLHQPHPSQIRDLLTNYLYLVDTGLWLLSEKALKVLIKKCGGKSPQSQLYDLYQDFGSALGQQSATADPIISQLTCAVAPLPEATAYYFQTTRQLIESLSGLQNVELDESKLGLMGAKRHPDQYLQNARFSYPLRLDQNHTLWVENSVIPKTWELAFGHVLTGVPQNDWDLRLEPGVCLDFVPIGQQDFCVRVYGLDDDFSGKLGGETRWLGRAPASWFEKRGLTLAAAGLKPESDIFEARLFPILPRRELEPRFIEWLFQANPPANEEFRRRYCASQRLSGREVRAQANLPRLYAQRTELREACLLPMLRNYRYSVFFKLDLESTAKIFAASPLEMPALKIEAADGLEPLQQVHDQIFRAAVLRHRKKSGWQKFEANAFQRLREMIVRDAQLSPATPRRDVHEDQIVWGRSPVRLDLAGGWTDTPPYCLEYGGKVVNVAVDLNGQPPIQVFAKLSAQPEIVLRSIDLGIEKRVRSYKELDTYAMPGSEFALAKAAFALAGFLPRFHAGGGYATLAQQLANFGGGIELSVLSAVPKGSGLGTSSILAATILATLSDLCGLNWDKNLLFIRTLALEQMLTTGGGWQDQAGAIFRGIKLIETSPGLKQKPTLRWLPAHLFGGDYANKSILLYYTGITRLAKNILQEIVRGIFLNSPNHLQIVAAIGANAEKAYNALQECDYDELTAAIRNSWRLNQELDCGTNPPEIQAILRPIADHLAATKLLGAGGGGYLLMLAKDETAAASIQRILQQNPPNPLARFVQFTLSETGLQVTRS